jgi:hypothetical protein
MDFQLKLRLATKFWLDHIYWYWWRYAVISKPWYAIKTFIYIHMHARANAIALDNCMRALGQMKEDREDRSVNLMTASIRNDLLRQGYRHLPNGWKWRKN